MRKLPIHIIHQFTLLQLVCLIILWGVKSSKMGLLFPLFIALLVPVRYLAERWWFAPEHLAVLDAEQEPEEEAMDWSS